MIYDKLKPTEAEISHALNMQVRATLQPKQINYPPYWTPKTMVDKLVARNLTKHMTIEEVRAKFPQFSMGFIRWCIES